MGRCKTSTHFQVTHARRLPRKPPVGASVVLSSDTEGFLYRKDHSQALYPYRLVKVKVKQSGEVIWLVTNILEEDAYMIAAWYHRRWDIEMFFKFIKQHLNVTHLVSRSENGIKVMIYMTLIVAALVMAYRKSNNLKSYKIAKLKFEIELENDIIKTIVVLCGGDPRRAALLWNSS